MPREATRAQPPVALRTRNSASNRRRCSTASAHSWDVRARSSGWMTSIQPRPSISSGFCPVSAHQVGTGWRICPFQSATQTMSAWVSTMDRKRSSPIASRRRSPSSSSASVTFSRASASLCARAETCSVTSVAKESTPSTSPSDPRTGRNARSNQRRSAPFGRLDAERVLLVTVRGTGAEHLAHRAEQRVVSPLGEGVRQRAAEELAPGVSRSVAIVDELVDQRGPAQVRHLRRHLRQQRLERGATELGRSRSASVCRSAASVRASWLTSRKWTSRASPARFAWIRNQPEVRPSS